METIKTRITNIWENGKLVEKPEEKIEAIIFKDTEGNSIVSIEDLAYLTDITLMSLKNYIRSKHILHYHISSKWFINLNDFWKKGERILE